MPIEQLKCGRSRCAIGVKHIEDLVGKEYAKFSSLPFNFDYIVEMIMLYDEMI